MLRYVAGFRFTPQSALASDSCFFIDEQGRELKAKGLEQKKGWVRSTVGCFPDASARH